MGGDVVVLLIIDSAGIPLVVIPKTEDANIIISGMISAVGKIITTYKSEMEYIKMKDGIAFLKNIGNVGHLIFIIRGINDPRDAEWVVALIENEMEYPLAVIKSGLIDDNTKKKMAAIYDILDRNVKRARELLEKYARRLTFLEK